MLLRRQTPLIIQSDEYECGYAALAMICAHHGLATTPSRLQAMCDKGSALSAADIREVGSAVGLRCRALKVPAHLLHDAITAPAILHWDRRHYVVLVSAGRKFRVHDPAVGVMRLSKHEFAARYSGVAISAVPDKHFRRSKELSSAKRVLVQELLRLARRTSGTFAGAVCLSVVLLLTLLFSPLFVRVAVDALGTSSSNLSFLAALAVCFGTMSIFSAGTQLVRDYVMLHWGVDLGMQLGGYVMGRLMGAKLTYFSTKAPCDVVSRFYAIEAIRSRLSEGSVGATIDGAMAILLLGAVVVIDVSLAGIVLAGMAAICLVRSCTYSTVRNWEATSVVLAAKERALTIENVQGIESIKALVVDHRRFMDWGATLHESARAGLEHRKRTTCVNAANVLIEGICDVAAITAAIWFVMEQRITVGDVFAFAAYKGMSALRRTSSTILQNDVVFSGTFAENIALGHEERDEERLRWAAEMAGIHDEIVERPLGYDTVVFDHGGISSGEKQRVVLARAFYRKPQLFVIDEGMAHLDDDTAGAVFGRLRRMGAACVLVTHDRRWATKADAVYEMAEGRLRRMAEGRDVGRGAVEEPVG